MENKTSSFEKMKAKNMALKTAREFRERGTGMEVSRKQRPSMKLEEKTSMREVNIMEPASKAAGRKMAADFEAGRNTQAMNKVRAESPMTFAERYDKRMPDDVRGKRFFKESNIRDWADRAETKSRLASARGRMMASNTKKLQDYWSK